MPRAPRSLARYKLPDHSRFAMSVCKNCHAGCCRSFAVPVTGADILRIEQRLKLTFWDFVCRWADPEGRIAQKHAPHFYFRDEIQTPFVISLKHSASAFYPGTTKCQFLTECAPSGPCETGAARCGVYHHRPAACRAFPTKLNETGELAIIYDVPQEGRSGNAVYTLCPRPWKPDDFDPLGTVSDLVVARFEMDFFHRVAAVWNRQPQEWTVFPEFLRTVYSRRIVPESQRRMESDEPVMIPFPTPAPRELPEAA